MRQRRIRGLLAGRCAGPIRDVRPARHPAIRIDVRPRALRRPGRRQETRARPCAGEPVDATRGAGTARRRAPLGAPERGRSAGCSAARTQDEPVKGLYIYGDVGRGKTMLMDLFFEASPVVRKRRVHFHEFMADVHERVRAFRQKLEARRDRRRGRDPARRRRDRRGELAALLRRVPRHRHRRRHDPRPAVRAAVRAGRGGGGDLERGAGRTLQGRAQPRAVPAVHRA